MSFDFVKGSQLLQTQAEALSAEGTNVHFRKSVSLPNPKLMVELSGQKALGLFECWATGETDYTIHQASKDMPMLAHRWGHIVDDQTIQQSFNDFVAEFQRIER